MKKILPLILFLASCAKEPVEPRPEKPTQFTATLSTHPTSKTLFYDLFVTNDPANRNDSFMIWAGRIDRNQTVFGFDFKKYVCKDFSVTPDKKLYGALREGYSLNDFGKKLIYESVTIK